MITVGKALRNVLPKLLNRYYLGVIILELMQAMQARRSIRKFKSDPVPQEYVSQLIEAARLAPSGTNLQPTRFVVVQSEKARAALNEATPLPFVTKAPLVLACCVDTDSLAGLGTRIGELKEAGAFVDTPLDKADSEGYSKRTQMDKTTAQAYLRLNAAIAIDHITLRAIDLGLGTCWIMMFDQAKAKQALQLGDNYHVVALLPVGYPDQAPAARPRLSLDELIIKEL